MNIAIIGAGFTGLSAAYNLLKKNHSVTIFEKDTLPGGLAIGFKKKGWDWTLEKHYHHWFTNDDSVLSLAKKINYEVIVQRPKTSVFVDEEITQFDSPLSLLKFSKLSLAERLRMSAVLGFLRYDPFWKSLENTKATAFLSKTMGEKAFKKIWEPQLRNKFGEYMDQISLAWFWARIKKRTTSLVYPKGGFLTFAQTLVEKIKESSGNIFFDTEVKKITGGKKTSIETLQNGKKNKMIYDAIIVTLPSFIFSQIAPELPQNYNENLKNLKSLGAINLIIRLKNKFLTDNTYWLSVCDTTNPLMAIVEHTNFIDKKYYDNEHIVYLGKYVKRDDPLFEKNEKELLEIYHPFLSKIKKEYQKDIIATYLFKAPFAQPIIPTGYSRIKPSFQTPLQNVFLANIEQVYPWDRGTNYAVELGQQIAELLVKEA